MKKLLKSANKKIVAILLVIMLLLSTVAIYNIYATIANEEESRGSEADKVQKDIGKYISYEDLQKMYDIFCCYHGGKHSHLPSDGDIILEVDNRSTTTTDSGKEIGKLVKSDEGKQTVFSEESTSATSPFKKNKYTAETYAHYDVTSTEIAKPKEAYILAEMIEEDKENGGSAVIYSDGYSDIQYAWWTTEAGHHGESNPPVAPTLAEEAAAFETYIASIAESTDPKDFVEQHYSFEKDGKVFEGEVPAPVITYKPSYDKDVNRDGKVDFEAYSSEAGRPTGGDKVTTTWDSNTQTWTVGPFMIDYVESSFSAGDRPDVDFSAITNAELSTNLGKVDKEHWKFNWIEGEREKEDKYEFPHQNELFYIELDYIEGATEITNLHFDFKYMNAGGKFDYLKGTFFEEAWTPDSKVIENCPGPTGNETTCSHGKKSSHPIKWKYWLKLTGMEENTSQLLAYGIIGARWYEKEELDLDTTPLVHEGSFKIVKKIVDENGNELTNIDKNKKFQFEITKDGEYYSTEWVSVNKPYVSGIFRWNEGESAPQFSVKEILTEKDKKEYTQRGAINVAGSLENSSLTFTAENTPTIHEGYVSITKRQLGKGLENMEFSFKLYIDSKVYVEDGKTTEDGTITLKVGETWTSNAITWLGNNAPKYKVAEINLPDGVRLVRILNKSGVVQEGKNRTANVVAINRGGPVPYSITLKKELTENIQTDDTFKFKVRVDSQIFVRTLKANESWTETFYRNAGEPAPEYEVEEINVPDDWEQVEIENKSGTLTPNGTVNVRAVNAPKEKSAEIDITKHTISNNQTDDTFTIVCEISGTFKIGDEEIVDGTKTITTKLKAEETVSLGTVIWKGDAPTYKVTETEIPANWKFVGIENESGQFKNGEKVTVLCTNTIIHKGWVSIEKQQIGTGLEEREFSFNLYIKENNQEKLYIKEGKTDNDGTIHIKVGDIWTSDEITWSGNIAPEYRVEEINIPSDVELVGGKVQNGTGNLIENETVNAIAKNASTGKKYKHATIIINKILSNNLTTDEMFTFTIKVGKDTYKGSAGVNNPWSKTFDWEDGTPAPDYEVTEIDIPSGWRQVSISDNYKGTLEANENIKVTAVNEPDIIDGGFQIYKEIVDKDGKKLSNVDVNKEFTFEISKNGTLYKTVTVTPDKPYSEDVTWKVGETAPKFEVKEVLKGNSEYKQYGEISAEGSLENKTLKFTAKNYKDETEHKGWVSIEKQQVGTGLEGREFNFKLTIDNKVYVEKGKTADDGTITLKVGETWKSNEITWKGDKAPTYKVEEINIPSDVELVGGKVQNGTGNLIENETVQTIAKNQPKIVKATIILKKELTANASSDEKFTFTVKVGEDTYTKCLKAGESWTETFAWGYGTLAPEYEVTEIDIPEEWNLVEIKNAKGTLESGQTVSVTAINEPKEEKSAAIKIHKETITDDKEGVDENDNVYTFVTRISGTFEMDGESIVNGTKTITTTLKKGETVTLDTVKWKGDKAPTYTVAETEIPDGWRMESITNSSGTLEDGKTIEVNCTNRFRIIPRYELTMEMSGMVWEDVALKPEDKNTEYSKPNGKYDAGAEQGIENVEVVIWKKFYDANGNEIVGLRKVATGYEEGTNTTIDFPLYTSPDGVWQAPKMEVPGLSDSDKAAGAVKADYDVEFTYDGQTYRPTDFLVSGSAEHFRKATNKQKSQYLNDSMAYEVEAERQDFDNKFETITGDLSIDDNGITEGYAVGTDGNKTDLLYYSTDSMPTVEGNTRKVSELQTLDEGYIREQYKMKSRTSTGGLTYPFDDKVHLVNVSKDIDKIEGGLIIRYHYSATYPYLLNVNLGLVKRDEAELALTKDVYSATVAVNQKLLNYKYNEYVDFESEEYKDYLDLQLKVTDASIAYKLDLYESDYYYRAKVYEANSELQGALEDFYKTLNKTDLSDELDLDVFLTYKISIYNQSENYRAKVKSVVDYFDEDLELVDSNITKYVQEADGKVVDSETVVATPAYVVQKGKTDTSTWGEKLRETIQGKVTVEEGKYTSTQDINTELANNSSLETSNNVKTEDTKSYYKANIDLKDVNYLLDGGEKLEIYLTFKVRTDEAPTKFEGNTVSDAVNSYVRLGTKANVAEISSYTTYYGPKDDSDKLIVAGKVDKDSAPNNVDIENKNEKSWYEDDTDSAPIITLDLYNETREISGFAWEDAQTEKIDYNQFVGNGLYNPEEGDQLIGNITTMLVEKVTVKQADGTYKDYDFVWPTNQRFDFLNGQTLKEVTSDKNGENGFDSIILTSNSPEDTGTYQFTNIPAGNYIVRVEYGNFPADALDANGNTVKLEGASEAKTSDGVPAVYNGQDFKTTAYQSNDTGKSDYATNEQGYIDNNEWYDFASVQYDTNGNVVKHNSDVIDNEARRLDVIAYSKVLDNEITTVLASANKYDADHTELYKNTYMFADTAKINLNIENMNSLKGQKVVVKDELSGQSKEVLAGDTETRNNLLTNTVIGKSDINGAKGTISLIDYNYKIEAIDAGLEERSNTEFVLDKEIESITLTTNSGEQILKAVYNIAYKFTLDEETGKSTYEAWVELNDKESYGTSNLIAQNKIEDKDNKEGQQNFRYIYYDDAISQSLNLEVVYRFTVLNLGEVDRTGKVADLATKEEIQAVADKLKDQIYEKDATGKLVRTHKALEEYTGEAYKGIGEYVGSIYYLGRRGSYTQPDKIVTTKARQLIDYVDNDAVFKAADNAGVDASWKSVTANELVANKVIDTSIIQEVDDGKNTILDDKGVAYTTTQRTNLALSVDEVSGDKLANPGFIVELVPFAASKEKADTNSTSCQAAMKMVITRSIDSQIDEEDLSYDNIAELVKLENAVGKRDIKTIAGNVNPAKMVLDDGTVLEGEFAASLAERDTSATEIITFTPPTGLGVQTSLTIEILIVGLAALAILGTGIVLIKKYVIK